jgi:D-tyrosyl-tRNA(Tyr) deacylase
VVQRVSRASVQVDGRTIGRIDDPGLCVLVGATHEDTVEQAETLARKVAELRILRHPDGPGSGRDERSALDNAAPILVISQFTLYADTRKGRRPSWSAAAPGAVAEPLVDAVVRSLRERGLTVATGRFGADMTVDLVNDGPVTLILEV